MRGRHLDERLAVHVPWLYRRGIKLAAALPRSRLTARAGAWSVRRNVEAFSREDFEVFMLNWAPDLETTIISDDVRALGFAERYDGHQGFRDMMRVWSAGWVSPRYAAEGVLFLHDRVIVCLKMTGRGEFSSAEVARYFGYVMDLADGIVVRLYVYWDWAACVEALGLDERTMFRAPISA